MILDVNFFPGWVRKSITFTIDDGNLRLDRKLIDYVKPAGIKGTFNLITPLDPGFSPDSYRQQYEGYEIANHSRYHTHPLFDGVDYTVCDEPFDRETADPRFLYKTEEEGLYYMHTYTWNRASCDKLYMEYVDSCTRDLENVFGKGSIRGYVWPYGAQNNKNVFEQLKARGFQSIRAAGCVKDTTGFSLPADRFAWSYNADDRCLNDIARLYEALPDDGQLKFFCFGVHAHDFENHGTWGELEAFCKTMGSRPDSYWYAVNHEIFDYEDAVNRLRISGSTVTNPGEVDLYIKADGQKHILRAGETLRL